jgi:hypothetical protein
MGIWHSLVEEGCKRKNVKTLSARWFGGAGQKKVAAPWFSGVG